MSNKIKIRLAKKEWDDQKDEETEHYLSILDQGTHAWNQWRNKTRNLFLDLRNISLFEKNLNGINLSGCNLSGAVLAKCEINNADLSFVNGRKINLENSNIRNTNLSGSYFPESRLSFINFSNSDFKICDLSDCSLMMSKFFRTDLRKANFNSVGAESVDFKEAIIKNTRFEYSNLRGSNFSNTEIHDSSFQGSILVDVDFSNSLIDTCKVFGVSTWGINLKNTTQSNLIISEDESPILTVDDLEIAHFIYMILDNPKLRNVIDIVTSKTVLILGRFTIDRKLVLDELKKQLGKRNLIPIIFDFDIPQNRDVKETVLTLAHLSKFIIADITDPKSIPMELMAIVPNLPSVPVKPIILKHQKPWAMFNSLNRYPWVLNLFEYSDMKHLIEEIDNEIIKPIELYQEENTDNNV